ncbi:MAG: hypothetical protein CL596_06690 [Alteromonas sp.]|nr:hypothetical protein [Alteromonas sp.]MAY23758.1 hypothetical protein [Flavobacteriaceae bacterium]
MRPQIVTKITALLFFLSSSLMLGQSPSASSSPPPPPQRTPIELPIDSSIYLLVIVGVIFGLYYILKLKKSYK